MGARAPLSASVRSSALGAKPRIGPVPLVWSVALRVSQDISIQASIEYVICFLTRISFTGFIPRVGRKGKYIPR